MCAAIIPPRKKIQLYCRCPIFNYDHLLESRTILRHRKWCEERGIEFPEPSEHMTNDFPAYLNYEDDSQSIDEDELSKSDSDSESINNIAQPIQQLQRVHHALNEDEFENTNDFDMSFDSEVYDDIGDMQINRPLQHDGAINSSDDENMAEASSLADNVDTEEEFSFEVESEESNNLDEKEDEDNENMNIARILRRCNIVEESDSEDDSETHETHDMILDRQHLFDLNEEEHRFGPEIRQFLKNYDLEDLLSVQ